MKRLICLAPALLAASLLSSCATPPPPAVQVRKVEVPVLRTEKCIEAKDIPAKPAGLPKPRPKAIGSALDIAVAKVLELLSYANKADALLRGCAAN